MINKRLRIKRIMIGAFVSTFLICTLSGYALGNVLIVDEPTETVPDITVEVVSQETTDESVNVYYDCPLDYELQDYIRELCNEKNVPMSLIVAMIEVESAFTPDIISKTNDYGLMQINAVNHEWLAEKYGITDFLDPRQNLFCGIGIISEHLIKTEGDIPKALMRYNLGATGARRLWDDDIYETSYTRKVYDAYERYENEI